MPPRQLDTLEESDRPAPAHQRTVVVLHTLPIRLEKDPSTGAWSASWDEDIYKLEVTISRYMALGIRNLSLPYFFIGGVTTFVPVSERQAVDAAIAAADLPVAIVHVEPSVASNYYQGFCKATLWPILHNVIDVYNHTEVGVIADDGGARRGPVEVETWKAPRAWNPTEAAEMCWTDYCKVNHAVAATVVENYLEGDLIWVHHYHLMLLPSYVARKLRNSATIGFYMHQPFPSSEIFRCLINREELLRGMLCADHIGFHIFEWAQNFIACCRRLLSCSSEVRRGGGLTLHYEGREIAISCLHMGVQPAAIMQRLPSSEVISRTSELQQRHAGYTLISSIDLLEGLKGVPGKLLAFENLLLAVKDRPRPLRLLLRGIVPDARPEDCAAVRKEVLSLVHRINGRFPHAVHFEEADSIPFSERLALYKVTDVLLVTSVREGLNLMPLEYLLTNEGHSGAIVLSEFCSLARMLSGAITCNPWSVRKTAAALERALSLSAAAREARLVRDIEWCKQHTASSWARRVISDVAAAAPPLAEGTAGVGRGRRASGGGLGLGLGWRPQLGSMGMDDGKEFTELRDEAVLPSYHATCRRLILLDHVGTLVPAPEDYAEAAISPSSSYGSLSPSPSRSASLSIGGSASRASFPSLLAFAENEALSDAPTDMDATASGVASDGSHAALHSSPTERVRVRPPPPSPAVRAALEVLCADPRNTVVVMSTCSCEELATTFGSIPGCSLSADNGLHVAWAGLHGRWEMGGGVAWQVSEGAQDGAAADGVWRELAIQLCQSYAERTDGAFAEAGANSVTFHFGQADPEFGKMQAKELHNHLNEVLRDQPVEVAIKPAKLRIAPRGVDKGVLLRHALDVVSPDFVLVVGDDFTDEAAFSELSNFRKRHPHLANHCFGCTIGRKPSRAPYFMDDHPSAAGLLEALKWGSLRATKSSSTDLHHLANAGYTQGQQGGLNSVLMENGHGGAAQASWSQPSQPAHRQAGWQIPSASHPSVITPPQVPTPSHERPPPPPMPPPSAVEQPSHPEQPHMTELPQALDPASLAASGCPFKQEPECAATGSAAEARHSERPPPASSVVLVAAGCITLLLALRATLRLRVRRRILVLLVAAAFSVPKWRNTLLRLADRLVF